MKILYVLLCLMMVAFSGTETELKEAREVYEVAPNDERLTEEFLKKIEPHSEKTLMMGYKGALTMIMAGHLFNPVNKWDTFNKGKKLLERALSKDPANAELVYLRYTIQSNIPSFLGYRKHLARDQAFLIAIAPHISDKDLQKRIVKYLLKSDLVQETDKGKLRTI